METIQKWADIADSQHRNSEGFPEYLIRGAESVQWTFDLRQESLAIMQEDLGLLTLDEVRKHNSSDDAWLVVNNVVWDVADFASYHPGGEEVIIRYFGRDASDIYNEFHGPGLIGEFLKEEKKVGKLSVTQAQSRNAPQQQQSPQKAKVRAELPDLQEILNLNDFEKAARTCLNEKAWAYISGATNDNLTRDWNTDWFQKLMFRPRVLRSVKHVDCSTIILGEKLVMPILNAPASSAILVHPHAEKALAKGLVSQGSIVIIPTMSSYSTEEIVGDLPDKQPFFYQLCVSEDRAFTKTLLDNAIRFKASAIVVTVDLPVFSKREANERYEQKIARAKTISKPGSVGNTQTSRLPERASRAIDPNLSWSDIKWIKEYTGLPVFVKGIQCAEDALSAYQIGCAGIYISNHGGRAVDTAQPAIVTLAEVRAMHPKLMERMIVLIDGGIRRGTDILKAICLGASAVCLGRPFFYALMYGQEGVEHALEGERLWYSSRVARTE